MIDTSLESRRVGDTQPTPLHQIERRRLGRDLHDGIGPTLTGVSLGLRAVVRRLGRPTERDTTLVTAELLARLADEIDSAVIEFKRIVRDLHPTPLDELGLVGAVVAFTRRFEDHLDVHVTLPDRLVELPSAVEVAAYHIVTEAVTNVVRHAMAQNCWLTIRSGTYIEIEVVDDGIGFTCAEALGVGLAAMRERADELGGSLELASNLPFGAHVYARLPREL